MSEDIMNRFKAVLQEDERRWNEYVNSEGCKIYSEGLKQTTQLYKDAKKDSGLQELIELEYVAITQECAYYEKRSPEIRADFDPVLESFEGGILNFIKFINSPEDYKIALITHSRSKKPNGVPKDAFHAAIAEHMTFLKRKVEFPRTLPAERDFFYARLENMKKAKKLYIEKQREIIGK